MSFIESLMISPGVEVHLRIPHNDPSVMTVTVVNNDSSVTISLDKDAAKMFKTVVSMAEDQLLSNLAHSKK